MPVPSKPTKFSDSMLIGVAREIVMEIHEPETIFKLYEITPADWEKIKNNQTFLRYVQTFQAEWHSAMNTEQRVRVKSAALCEQWLEEGNRQAWAQNQTLTSRVEVMKLISRWAGPGFSTTQVEGGAERITISINMGAEKPVKFVGDVTPKVIEHDPGK